MVFTLFGWRDYGEDGKQWVENDVENSVLHCLGSKGKKRGWKTWEKIFLRAHQFFSSQIGRKIVERKLSYRGITQMPSPNVYKFINSTPIFINSTPISNLENQQHTHIHQTRIKIHQTHIQIHINNQSEIEKRRKRRRRKKEEDAEENAKITIFSTQNFCFLCPKSLPLIEPNPKSSSIIKA